MDYFINLPNISLYYGSAILIFLIFIGIYACITPYRELIEIRNNRNAAAAVALSGGMIGFSLPVVSLIANSANLIDFFAWGTMTSVVQIVTFFLVAIVFRDNQERIKECDIIIAVILASSSIFAGIFVCGLHDLLSFALNP
ncbi:DUF350 domain-containing protein [Methylobacter sp. BlB1]|jgi:putative membrane protein|uniref:DUF350 domain-containing protein n=1 Tax=Methylobacter sp. BlB1 TaxID=2785914 RepID=UPI0018942AF2|nr:DUF350 domain-containing protein [Methylobacter sp. BlB1]MBF6650033.1 DUF350 domain-containing protein [Methylobacter sp. BlB1]